MCIEGYSIWFQMFLGYNIFIIAIEFKDRIMEIKKCTTLEEARSEIDNVDKEIVELIAKRNEYIKQIAHFKTSIDEIKAGERIADVIAHVREQAISLGLSPNLINDLYIRMIDEMVESEISEFKNAQRY